MLAFENSRQEMEGFHNFYAYGAYVFTGEFTVERNLTHVVFVANVSPHLVICITTK